MIRLTFAVLMGLLATPLFADEEVVEYHDTIFLYDHETARYRLDIEDYGGGPLNVDVYVRGFGAPPRARVLEEDYDEVKRREDTSGDDLIDFDFTADPGHPRYYIEIDSAHPGYDGTFELRIFVSSAEAQVAFADVDFQKVFLDYDDGGKSDHVTCAASTEAAAWPVLALLGLAALAAACRRLARS